MVGKSACRLDLLNFAFKEEAAAFALTFVEMEIACKSWRNACSNLCAASLLCSNGLGGCCGWSAWMNALASPSELETDSAPAWSPAKFGVASATPLPLSEPLALRHWFWEGVALVTVKGSRAAWKACSVAQRRCGCRVARPSHDDIQGDAGLGAKR